VLGKKRTERPEQLHAEEKSGNGSDGKPGERLFCKKASKGRRDSAGKRIEREDEVVEKKKKLWEGFNFS